MSTRSSERILPFRDQQAWAAWLAKHHGTAPGVWLKLAKKTSGIPSVTHAEALETALCYGWIDAMCRGLDAKYFLQRFTPRKERSTWSKINRSKALALIAAGKMKPPGRREIERAKADGRWKAAYDSAKNASVPKDLQTALDRNARAKAFFATLKGQNRYSVLYRVQTARTAEARAEKINRFVRMLAKRETLHP